MVSTAVFWNRKREDQPCVLQDVQSSVLYLTGSAGLRLVCHRKYVVLWVLWEVWFPALGNEWICHVSYRKYRALLSVTGDEMFDLVIYISKGLSIVFYR